MPVPLRQQARVGAYVVKQRLARRARYPLVLMLEPLFRCNLACPGCGKIDYPDPILNRRLSADECVAAARECGAPIVSIAGGEPLLHHEMGEIVRRMIDDKRFIYLCTNALLLEKKIDLFRPSPYLTFSIHLDGLEEEHDRAVDLDGVFERAVAAVRMVRDKGFRVNVNTTLFDGVVPAKVAEFLDFATELGVEGVTISPGYSYERGARPGAFPQAPGGEGTLSRGLPPRRGQEVAVQPVEPCSSTSSPATNPINARRGAIRRATSSAGSVPAIS